MSAGYYFCGQAKRNRAYLDDRTSAQPKKSSLTSGLLSRKDESPSSNDIGWPSAAARDTWAAVVWKVVVAPGSPDEAMEVAGGCLPPPGTSPPEEVAAAAAVRPAAADLLR